jgi:hypothetical protein
VVALSAAACGSSSDIPDACNPLGGEGCLLPWPSSAYEVKDSSTVTGRRIELPIEAMPKNLDGLPIDPGPQMNRWDGFSLTGPMLAAFPTGVSNANLPSWKNPDESLAADSPIVLINADTGQRVAFFAEVDQNTTEITQRNLIIRPLERLAPKSHYVVGIRNSVKAADGSELPISEGFQAALSGDDYGHSRFSSARYKTIFEKLKAAGVEKSELVLAWDFHTASNEMLRNDLLTMRDAALPAMGGNGENLTFTASPRSPVTGLYKSFLGTYKSPNFLTDGEEDNSRMRRAADWQPVMDGMRDARFAALIPECVTTQPLPRPLIIFGHGLFGSSEEYLDNQFVIDLAQDFCFVIVAGDFIGLTSRQFALAPLVVNDLNKAPQISEKLAQSVIDFMALETIARHRFGQAPEFQYNGQSVIDPSQTFYVGGSLGGIMGNVFMAYDPNITKGVLAVPGGVWSMMFERSHSWHILKGAAMGAYEDPAVYELNVAFLGMAMEPYDPITTAENVLRDPLPGTPAKNILIWYAIADSLVTNIATEMVARTMGIDLLGPAVKPVWGMPPKPGPLANAITVYDEHPTSVPSDFNLAPGNDNGTHAGVNDNPAVLRQVEPFLLQGQILQTCGGTTPAPCDCATGACD